MPVTETGLSYEDMQKMAAGHFCGKCGGIVGVAWDGGQYVLRCGNDITHNTITRHDAEHEKQIQEVRRVQKLDSKSLMVMPLAEMVERVGMAKFPKDLTPAESRLLAQVAITYGFDPLMGEVTIYQGRPWVSIDGRYRKAQETGELDGVETRPANKQERADWEIPDGDKFFRAEIYRKGAARAFVGWGRVWASEMVGDPHLPTVKNPQRMAEKRAEAQGLRKGFHIPLPSIEDIGTPAADEVKGSVTATIEDSGQNPPSVEKATASKAGTAPKSKIKPRADWDKVTEVKLWTDLLSIAYDLAGLQPKELYRELGGTCMSDMTLSAWDAFLSIKELYCPKEPATAA